VKCLCGHVGAIKMREADASFSPSWERYTLEGLDGGERYQVNVAANFDEVFAALKPTCPMCKEPLTRQNLTD
jgi:hypothetical protein